jgi:hypothetical protein
VRVGLRSVVSRGRKGRSGRLVWGCVGGRLVVAVDKRFVIVVVAAGGVVVDAFGRRGLASMRFRRRSFEVVVGFVGG